ALGVRLKKRHSALLVVHLESPNLSPRALIGAFSGATGPIGLVLTGPRRVIGKQGVIVRSILTAELLKAQAPGFDRLVISPGKTGIWPR
ncbi:MAG: hypothetical protein ABW134_17720, partial [Candidatus Thiodiazotropha endolucinida]